MPKKESIDITFKPGVKGNDKEVRTIKTRAGENHYPLVEEAARPDGRYWLKLGRGNNASDSDREAIKGFKSDAGNKIDEVKVNAAS